MSTIKSLLAGAIGYGISEVSKSPYDELPTNGTERTEYIMDASILQYHTETEYDVLERSNTYSFCLINDNQHESD